MVAAAKLLHVTPAAVSLGITSLEDGLGCQLLIRVPHRPLALTAMGRSHIGDVRRLLDSVGDIASMAQSSAGDIPLVVGCFTTLAPTYVPSLVAKSAEVLPAAQLEFREESQAQLQQSLLEGRCELAIMYQLDLDPSLDVVPIAVTRPHVIMSPDHPLAGRGSLSLESLVTFPMVMLDIHPSKAYFVSIFSRLGLEPVIERTSGSFEAVRSLVARNQGWSMLIQNPVIDVSYEGLPVVTMRIADQVEDMPIVLARVGNAKLTRRAMAFERLCLSLN